MMLRSWIFVLDIELEENELYLSAIFDKKVQFLGPVITFEKFSRIIEFIYLRRFEEHLFDYILDYDFRSKIGRTQQFPHLRLRLFYICNASLDAPQKN